MKRYYTVKEASRLLGISTNTIYKYLKEGKLNSRRIGRGRFKIPYAEIAPFMRSVDFNDMVGETSSQKSVNYPSEKPAPIEPIAIEKENPEEPPLDLDDNRVGLESKPLVTTDQNASYQEKKQTDSQETLAEETSSKLLLSEVFYSVLFMGLGISMMFSVQRYKEVFFSSNIIIPIGYIFFGVLMFVISLFSKKEKDIVAFISSTSFLISIPGIYMSYISQEYLLVSVLVSVAIYSLLKLIKSVINRDSGIVLRDYCFYSIVLVMVFGFFVLVNRDIYIFSEILNKSSNNLFIFLGVWFGVLGVLHILIYFVLYKSIGLVKTLVSFFGILFFGGAIYFSKYAYWEISFFCYLYSIFSFFIARWHANELIVNFKKKNLISVSFFWASSVVLFGLYSVLTLQTNMKEQKLDSLQESVAWLAEDVDYYFSNLHSMVRYVASQNSSNISQFSQSETAGLYSGLLTRDMYSRIDSLQSVLVYNDQGRVVDSYPKNLDILDVDYSEKDEFIVTKDSLREYTTVVFNDGLRGEVVVQTEPLFYNNSFLGVVSVAVDLEQLSSKYQKMADGDLFVIDDGGRYVLGSYDKGDMGLEYKEGSLTKENELLVEAQANSPGWRIVLISSMDDVYQNIAKYSLVISLVIATNTFFSIVAGFYLTRREA